MSEHPSASCLTTDVAYAMEALVRIVERQSGRFIASVLLLSDEGDLLVDAAGPSLPADYRSAVHGLPVGPCAGSCGTAAFRNERVIVTQIAGDPLWADFRHLAAAAGLAACWSQPIRSSGGAVLGTFALYYPEPRSPSTEELAIIDAAAARAGLILERAGAGADRAALVAGLT